MYVIDGYEQFCGETCHLVYLELVLNFQILFQTMCRLQGVAESEVSDFYAPSVYAVPHYCPNAKQ